MNQDTLVALAQKVAKKEASQEERVTFFREISELLNSLKQEIKSSTNQ